jgi:hypothetical protein
MPWRIWWKGSYTYIHIFLTLGTRPTAFYDYCQLKTPCSVLSCNTDNAEIILSRVRVAIDGVWLKDRIYWTLWYNAWLHYSSLLHTHTHTHTSVYSHVFISLCSVAASNSGRSPSSVFPNYPRASATNSHQQLTITEPQQFSNSLKQLNRLNSLLTSSPAYNISARTAKKTPFPVTFYGPLPVTAVLSLFRSRCLTSVLYATI